MATENDSECSFIANLSEFNDFDDIQVTDYVEIEEVTAMHSHTPSWHDE